MRFIFANPIFISFACLSVVLLVVVFSLGGNLREAATLIFTPYFSEAHLRLGKSSEGLLRAIPVLAQIGMLVLILVRSQLNNKYAKVALSIFGVLLVIGYFVFLASVQFLASIH